MSQPIWDFLPAQNDWIRNFKGYFQLQPCKPIPDPRFPGWDFRVFGSPQGCPGWVLGCWAEPGAASTILMGSLSPQPTPRLPRSVQVCSGAPSRCCSHSKGTNPKPEVAFCPRSPQSPFQGWIPIRSSPSPAGPDLQQPPRCQHGWCAASAAPWACSGARSSPWRHLRGQGTPGVTPRQPGHPGCHQTSTMASEGLLGMGEF